MKDESASLDGRIELKGLLGAGGMGEVHRAWDRALERAVAVKFFKGAGPRESERLLLEGRLQARVDDPHVVRVFDAGTLQGRACLVLQLVEGRSLAELAPALSLDQRIELVRQAALGVHAAHRQGLVHRDVKPGNILVEQGPGAPRALVSDFGLARGEEPGLTRSGVAAGTLAFMSPEQLLGEGPVGFAADVYGLGATLYAALSGHPPHAAPPSSAATPLESSDLFRRLLEGAPPRPKGLPRPLGRVVAKAMERSPGSRYESAEAFAADLARFQKGEPVSARPASVAERALAWRRRNRAFARAMGATALALLLSVGWAIWSARRADLEALEAARLGALGESMEAELRMEFLSPPHDLRPAFAKVRAQVEALRRQATKGGGPASFALGKGLELLGDVEGARAAYERAWALGFRIPRVAEGLGNALGEQYRLERQRADEALEPAAREKRLTTLRAELREPAIRYLTLADSGGWRTAFLQASIALLEGDYSVARARAAAVLSSEPGRYEAIALQAEAFIEEADWQANDERIDEAVALSERGSALAEKASQFGRSDLGVARARLRAEYRRLNERSMQGGSMASAVDAISKTIAQAKVLDPDDPAVMVFEAKVRYQQVLYSSSPAEGLRSMDEAIALLRRALQLDGGQVRTLCALGDALYAKAYFLQMGGTSSLEPIVEGLAAVQRASARAPWDPRPLLTRSWLRSIEAEILVSLGKPGEMAHRSAAEAAEEALRLGIRGEVAVRRDIGEARVGIAMGDWRNGQDPRAELERALSLLEEAQRSQPGLLGTAEAAAVAHEAAAQLLLAMGADAKPHFERARVILEKLLEEHPHLSNMQVDLAMYWSLEASQQAAAGSDPREALAKARRFVEAVRGRAEDNASLEDTEAVFPLFEAQWERSQGRDPAPLAARAERALEKLIQRRKEEPGKAFESLARCALERALFARRAGRDATAPARQGLASLSRKLEKEPRSPELWALRARLLIAAGDREEAQKSLERAWATNPLVRGGPDSRLAEAELAAAVRGSSTGAP